MVRELRSWIPVALLLQLSMVIGCSKDKAPKREPTFPVTGTVQIDGKPTAGVRVLMYPDNKRPDFVESNMGAPHSATTDSEGKFKITTYETGDGAPVGEYVLIFHWNYMGKVVPFSNPDEPKLDPAAVKFNKKYFDIQKTKITAKVEAEKPTDLGVLDLTTK